MANNLQKVHGSVQPVFSMDVANGTVTSLAPDGNEVNFVGPAMDFFGIATIPSLSVEMGVGGAVEAIIQNITQLGTVMLYQVETGATAMSIAVYPKGAYTAATLQTQLRLLTSVGKGPITLAGVTCTDVGFKLAVA